MIDSSQVSGYFDADIFEPKKRFPVLNNPMGVWTAEMSLSRKKKKANESLIIFT
jgi:hypothetical protein